MQIGRIAGTVVSTAKERPSGRKLMVVKTLDPTPRKPAGTPVAVDAVGAGVGEVVLVASGSSARLTEATRDRPSDAVIMAIVDSWDIDGAVKWRKSS